MIITSDNTATDVMATKVGGVDGAQRLARGVGLQDAEDQPRLGVPPQAAGAARSAVPRHHRRRDHRPSVRRMADNPLFAHYRSLFTGERATWLDVVRDPANRRRRAEDTARLMVEDRNIWLGDMTARDIGRMLEAIERETIASPASAAVMRTFMRRQLAGSRRLPHFIDVPVAHKTGDAGNIANDVGIIYSRSGPIVVAVMVTGITGSLGEAEDRIGRLAQLIVNHFDQAQGPPVRDAHQAADSAAELQADAVAADAGDSDRRHVISVGQHRR